MKIDKDWATRKRKRQEACQPQESQKDSEGSRFTPSSQLRQSGHFSRSIRLRSWCQAASLNQDIAKTCNVKGNGSELTDMLEPSASKFIVGWIQ